MSSSTSLIVALVVASAPFELCFAARVLRRARERRAAGTGVTGTSSYIDAPAPRSAQSTDLGL